MESPLWTLQNAVNVFFQIFSEFEPCLGEKSTGITESFLQIDKFSFKIGVGAPIRPRRGELTEAEAATVVWTPWETSMGGACAQFSKTSLLFSSEPP